MIFQWTLLILNLFWFFGHKTLTLKTNTRALKHIDKNIHKLCGIRADNPFNYNDLSIFKKMQSLRDVHETITMKIIFTHRFTDKSSIWKVIWWSNLMKPHDGGWWTSRENEDVKLIAHAINLKIGRKLIDWRLKGV